MITTPPTREEIQRVISNLRVRKHVHEKNGPHVIADCPTCGKGEHLYVNEDTGDWDCKRCDASGGLFSLATAIGMRLRSVGSLSICHVANAARKVLHETFGTDIKREVRDAPGVTLTKVEEGHARLWNPDDTEGQAVLGYLHMRGFDDETIRRFKLCAVRIYDKGSAPEPAVGIPYIEDGKVTLVKMRNLADDKEQRKFRRTKGGNSGLFNGEAVRDCKQVVLVEGELDACSLWQMGVTNVASTSLGAKKDIPETWVRTLATADDVVLFYDDDDKGREVIAGLVDRLGQYRGRVARIPDDLADQVEEDTGKRPKDANDLLRANVPPERVKAIIDSAQLVVTGDVTAPSSFSDLLGDEIDKGVKSLGIPIPWLNLAGLLRGLRQRELTIVTGETGSGKTTGTTALLEALAVTSVPVLALGMENGPLSLVRKLFMRKIGRPISSLVTDADREMAKAVLARIDEVPYYVGKKQGRYTLAEIANAVEYAVQRLGVKVVMIDHMHYVAKPSDRVPDVEHYENIVATCSELATRYNVHVLLVAHPNNTVEENQIPGGRHIKGGSSARQVADNGMSWFRCKDMDLTHKARNVEIKMPEGRKFTRRMDPTTVLLLVWKTRHDEASTGLVEFEFNKWSQTYKPVIENSDKDDKCIDNPDLHTEARNTDAAADPFLDLN